MPEREAPWSAARATWPCLRRRVPAHARGAGRSSSAVHGPLGGGQERPAAALPRRAGRAGRGGGAGGPLLRAGVGAVQGARQPDRRAEPLPATACRPREAEALLPRDVRPLARVFPVLRRVEARGRPRAALADSPRPAGAAPPGLRGAARAAGAAGRPPARWSWPSTTCSGATSTASACWPSCCARPTRRCCCWSAATAARTRQTSPCLRGLPPAGRPRPRLRLPRAGRRAADDAESARTWPGCCWPATGPAAEAGAEPIARQSGGNPFFVHELARHLQAAAPTDRPGGAALTLDEVLWQRVLRPARSRRGGCWRSSPSRAGRAAWRRPAGAGAGPRHERPRRWRCCAPSG